jgi:AcrR family transcriptional regulator
MPKPLIPVETIYDAALEILEDDGATALNARNLTTRLRCSTKTLYQQVGNREEMIRGVIRYAFAKMELDFRPGADIADTIHSWATTLRAALLARPALGGLMTIEDRGVVVDYAMHLVNALRGYGLDEPGAVRVAGIVSHITISMTLSDIQAPGAWDDPEVFETTLQWLTDGMVRSQLPAG